MLDIGDYNKYNNLYVELHSNIFHGLQQGSPNFPNIGQSLWPVLQASGGQTMAGGSRKFLAINANSRYYPIIDSTWGG